MITQAENTTSRRIIRKGRQLFARNRLVLPHRAPERGEIAAASQHTVINARETATDLIKAVDHMNWIGF